METAEAPQPVEKELQELDPIGKELTELHSTLLSSYLKIAKKHPKIDYNHALPKEDRLTTLPWPLDQKDARIQAGEQNIGVVWERADGMTERISLDYTIQDPINHTEPTVYFTRDVSSSYPKSFHEMSTYVDGRYTKQLNPQDPMKPEFVTLTPEDWMKSEDRAQVLKMTESFKQMADRIPEPHKGILGRFRR